MRVMVPLPAPEQRLCQKIGKDGKPHNRPIIPSSWLRGCRTTCCSKCSNEHHRLPEFKKRREEHWEKEFIACVNHPNRKCQKSQYKTTNGQRLCSFCLRRRKDGSLTPCKQRHENDLHLAELDHNRKFRDPMMPNGKNGRLLSKLDLVLSGIENHMRFVTGA